MENPSVFVMLKRVDDYNFCLLPEGDYRHVYHLHLLENGVLYRQSESLFKLLEPESLLVDKAVLAMAAIEASPLVKTKQNTYIFG